MKTAELIATLAAGAGPCKPTSVIGRLGLASGVGAVVALVCLIGWLGLRPMGIAVRTPSFWMKGAYTLGLALAGLFMATRLSRPGGRSGGVPALAAGAFAGMSLVALYQLAHTPAFALSRAWLGDSWDQCPFRILALAIPTWLAIAWALRRLAPTRLAQAGAAAGLLAGGVGATVYGLYCQETTAAFLVTWYTLGIAASTALGAAAGPKLLRW